MNDRKVIFLRQLSLLLRSGIPLLRALNIVKEQQKGVFRTKLERIIVRIESGETLSKALSEDSDLKENVPAIRIAETRGDLESALDRAAAQTERKLNFRSGLLKSLAYPLVVLSVCFLCLAFLMVFILPMFSRMFSDNSIPLPLVTKILMAVSEQCSLIAVAVMAVIIAALWVFREPDTRFRIPCLGRICYRLHLAEACHNIGSQLEAGVPAIESIRSAKEGAKSRKVAGAIGRILDGVTRGEPFSTTIADRGVFPEFVAQIVMVGEESGSLGRMLVTAGGMLEAQAEESLRRLALMVEPAATLTVGLVVGFIAFSVMMPMFSMVSSLI